MTEEKIFFGKQMVKWLLNEQRAGDSLMKNISIILSILLSLLLTVSAAAAADKDDETTVVVTGMADGTTAKSRDEALADALRLAVKQGMGTFVSSDTLVENMILIEDRIYSETSGYIKSYEVIRENTEDGFYKVKISAIVKLGKLANDLESIGLLIRKKQNPRVMVVLYSQEVGNSYWDWSREGNRNIENQIESGLMRKKFRIVDAGQVKHKKQVETAVLRNDYSRASKIAKDFGAEVLIVGDVRRAYVDERKLYGRRVRFFSNEIRLKALETDTAKVLYSGFRTKPPSGQNYLAPIEEASAELIDEMTAGILEQWRQDVYQIASYQLDITGASFKDISSLKKKLKKIRGFGGVQTRNFQSGIALLEVKYQGTLEELAEKISDINPAFEITGLQSNTIEMKVSK